MGLYNLCWLSTMWKFQFVILVILTTETSADPEVSFDKTYDFIVVGGGTSGCAIAGRLSENGKHSVLLIERGPEPPEAVLVPALIREARRTSNISRVYQMAPQKSAGTQQNGVVQYLTASCMGGGSSINEMYFNRGSPYDYDNWASITGDDSWKYSNLLRLFKKMESYKGLFPSDQHGYSGPIAVSRSNYAPAMNEILEAGKYLGFPVADQNGPQRISFTPIEFSMSSGRRVSSYEAYIRPYLTTRKNLNVVTNAEVFKILIDKNQAVGVMLRSLSGENVTIRASKEVIVSAGVINSPVILMKSGIGPRAILEAANIPVTKNLPVGSNAHDHFVVIFRMILKNSSEVYSSVRDLTLENFLHYQSSGDGPYTHNLGTDVQAFVASSFVPNDYNKYLGWADLHLIFLQTSDTLPIPGYPEVSPDELDDNEIAVSAGVILVRPKSRGSIQLNTTNPESDPLIDLGFLSEASDVEATLEGIKLMLKVFEDTPQFQRHGARLPKTRHPACSHLKFRSDDYWRCVISQSTLSAVHASGSVRMGHGLGDDKAVLDSRLRVLGVKNLRVADCSIMPEVVNANTQVAAYVIAEKVSEDILQTWDSPLLNQP